MKSNKEILDEFGKEVVQQVFDDGFRYFNQVLENNTKWNTGEKFSHVFNKLSDEDKEIAREYIKEVLGSAIFSFLGIFEENTKFKILFEDAHQKVDLTEISEMLKAEPTIENGWIARFSKERDLLVKIEI